VAHEFNLRYEGPGITVNAARNWLNGVSIPRADKLQALARWLQVSPQDLLFDAENSTSEVGCACPSGVVTPPRHGPCSLLQFHSRLSASDASMLRKYAKLSKFHQYAVREIVEGFSQSPCVASGERIPGKLRLR
jgi:transcriptional regulator with XRE-family HTH domain